MWTACNNSFTVAFKIYNNALEFVKVITQNIVNLDIVKMAFLMTSQLCQHYSVIMLIHGQFSNILVKWSLGMIRDRSCENTFKLVKVMHRIL